LVPSRSFGAVTVDLRFRPKVGSDRWGDPMKLRELAPLSGVASVVLILASFAVAGSAPSSTASQAKVMSFYATHLAGQKWSGVLLSLGALLFLIFASTLVTLLGRSDARRGGATTLCLGGAVVAVVGMTIFAALALTIGQVTGKIDPSALQALHVLNQEMVFPLTVGSAAFLLGGGVAVLQTGMFPRWVGWFAVAFGVVAAVPSHVVGGVLDHIGFLGFLGLAAWTVIISILSLRLPADDHLKSQANH
jgi:hypothetical protein